jgi:hypothetical protein
VWDRDVADGGCGGVRGMSAGDGGHNNAELHHL